MLMNLAGVYWDMGRSKEAWQTFKLLLDAIADGRIADRNRKCQLEDVNTFMGLALIADGDVLQGERCCRDRDAINTAVLLYDGRCCTGPCILPGDKYMLEGIRLTALKYAADSKNMTTLTRISHWIRVRTGLGREGGEHLYGWIAATAPTLHAVVPLIYSAVLYCGV